MEIISKAKISKAEKWWQKEIDPTFSFFFLIISLLFIFIIGAVFIKQYMDVWSEMSQRQNENFFIKDIQKINKEKTEEYQTID